MKNLLIVDDEKHVVDWLYEMFIAELNGIVEIKKACTSSEALGLIDSVRFDVALLDIKMPGMNGFDLMEKIYETCPNCRVIFLSGYDEFDYVYRAIQHEGVRYLLKSEDDDVILATVKKELTKSQTSGIFADDIDGFTQIPKNEIVDKTHAYVREHLGEELSLINIADYLHYHPAYVSRCFKQSAGKSLSEYIVEARLSKAKTLLINSGETIIRIAKKTGFSSSQYFSTVFKKALNMTPQEYRAQNVKL